MSPHAALRSVALVLLLALAACGGSGAAGSPASSPQQPAVSQAISAPVSPPATTPARLDQPPVATLSGLSAAAVPGDQGSFSWDGFVSDGPWVLGTEAGTVRPGGTLEVGFRPALAPTGWQARWAAVAGGAAGDPVAGGAGGPGSLLLRAPGTPGSWSLQLTARFGDGRAATWYWRVRVTP